MLKTEKDLSGSDLSSSSTEIEEGQVDKDSFEIVEVGKIVAFGVLEIEATEILPLRSLCLWPCSILS